MKNNKNKKEKLSGYNHSRFPTSGKDIVRDKQAIDFLEKNILDMTDEELDYLLDTKWYVTDLEYQKRQRKIWDYSYLMYKGIILQNEIDYKKRKDTYGIYVNVPRTFATIEGIRRNMNINKLSLSLEKYTNDTIETEKNRKIQNFINYDFDRSKTKEQIKNAGFNKLLFGNGFLYSFLVDRKGDYKIALDKIDKKTGRVAYKDDDKNKSKYYGLVARSISPYCIIPDKDGTHHDVNNHSDKMCTHTCIRTVKHISQCR